MFAEPQCHIPFRMPASSARMQNAKLMDEDLLADSSTDRLAAIERIKRRSQTARVAGSSSKAVPVDSSTGIYVVDGHYVNKYAAN